MRFNPEAYSLSTLYLTQIMVRFGEGYPLVRQKNQKFEMLGERWLKSGMGKINKREWQKHSGQLCLESINTDMQ